MRQTNITDLLESQDGGAFKEKLERILSDVASAVINEGKAGTVVLEMKLSQIKNSSQVTLTSTLKYNRPRPHGSMSEKYETCAPFYVNSGGKMTFFPEKQTDLFKEEVRDGKGDPV